jgi:hypothetical protein
MQKRSSTIAIWSSLQTRTLWTMAFIDLNNFYKIVSDPQMMDVKITSVYKSNQLHDSRK